MLIYMVNIIYSLNFQAYATQYIFFLIAKLPI